MTDNHTNSSIRRFGNMLKLTKSKETHTRSIAKSLSYRVYSSFLVTPLVSYIITHSFTVSISLGLVEFLVKPFTYFLFERVWAHIATGYEESKIDLLKRFVEGKR
ncbi:MAG: DUF2061 domain-containing protein [Methermicoccaceae archaeon]